jgi:tetratricopeptide (TPR) repeat protein
MPSQIFATHVLGAFVFLLAITGITLARVRRQPFELVGWLWFLGTLVPMIGLVKIGDQAMADRYTYLPHIGLLTALVWGGAEWGQKRGFARRLLQVLAVAVLLACLAMTTRQLRYWRSSKSVFTHCLDVTRDNFVAHLNLGFEAMYEGKVDEAVRHYTEAMRINPLLADHPTAMATALLADGRPSEALAVANAVFQFRPDFADAHAVAGEALAKLGRPGEAIVHYQKALENAPPKPELYHHLGQALASLGRWPEAIDYYTRALQLQPDFPAASNDLATARASQK